MNDETAFPTNNGLWEPSPGMMLRDYFAAKALQGILTDPNLVMGKDSLAEWSYEMADAMLKARGVKS